MRALLIAACLCLSCAAPAAAADWVRFGVDPQRSSEFRGATRITSANAGRLVRQRITVPGTVDSAPLYLDGVDIAGARRDVFIATETYGRTFMIDADSGAILWTFAPRGIARWEGKVNRYTTATPVVDRARRAVYAPAPDGLIHKLALGGGRELRAGRWPVRVTKQPTQEKLSSALNIAGRRVLVSVASFQSRFPYEGHVVSIDKVSGRIRGIFNAVCAKRRILFRRGQCKSDSAGIWGRGGAVVEPGSGRLLLTTGNGPLNHPNAFGNSLLELSPDARRLFRVWNPRDYRRRQLYDIDLGSGSPALIRHRDRLLAFQADKTGRARIVDVRRMRRRGRPGKMPGLRDAVVVRPRAPFRTAPTVWQRRSMVFLANDVTVNAFRIAGRRPRIVRVWQRRLGGSTPVLAGGLLHVFDPIRGRLNVLDPASGRTITTHAASRGHWNSPVVADGRVALGAGDARKFRTTGSFYIWRLP